MEKKRFGENAEALARNQEDLRKRELKICALEKDNETMKKKIADLEEDLRVSGVAGLQFLGSLCVCISYFLTISWELYQQESYI